MSLLSLSKFSVSVDKKPILHQIDLLVSAGSLHVIMGPNGSGKSTLAYSLAGHPLYAQTGQVILGGKDLSVCTPDERAQSGMFLAFQYPCAIPGVTVTTCLFESYRAIRKEQITFKQFSDRMFLQMDCLGIDHSLAQRSLNEGFSGGERKRLEILQALLLRPKLLILDEIDSGLDVDALRLVGKALALFRKENPTSALLIITHYRHILTHLTPDYVHILIDGRIVLSGSTDLALQVERFGFDAIQGSFTGNRSYNHSVCTR